MVVVPFPFTDRNTTKRRPALIISSSFFNNIHHYICAVITTKTHFPRPGDGEIKDYKDSGLNHPGIVRFKLFTLDHRLICKKIGELSPRDKKTYKKSWPIKQPVPRPESHVISGEQNLPMPRHCRYQDQVLARRMTHKDVLMLRTQGCVRAA
ncbi:MAG: type II toxin-antitoxin system PemK/MazF family toxin, partial [bacterium]